MKKLVILGAKENMYWSDFSSPYSASTRFDKDSSPPNLNGNFHIFVGNHRVYACRSLLANLAAETLSEVIEHELDQAIARGTDLTLMPRFTTVAFEWQPSVVMLILMKLQDMSEMLETDETLNLYDRF